MTVGLVLKVDVKPRVDPKKEVKKRVDVDEVNSTT